MAVSYKVLGQSKPSSATLTTLYTVPTGSGNYAVASTLSVANLSTANETVRVAVRPAGASISDEHYIIYEQVISAYQTIFYTIGVTAASTDVISVRSSGGNCVFSLFGSENS